MNRQNTNTENKEKGLRQLISFGLVGLFNTVLSMAIYNLFYHLFGTSYHVANVMQFMISVFSAYVLQSNFVFKKEETEKRVWWKTLIKTYISYAVTGLVLTELLLALWIDIIKIENHIGFFVQVAADLGVNMTAHDMAVTMAQIINIFFTIPINFLLNKKWTYGKGKSKPDNENRKNKSAKRGNKETDNE